MYCNVEVSDVPAGSTLGLLLMCDIFYLLIRDAIFFNHWLVKEAIKRALFRTCMCIFFIK